VNTANVFKYGEYFWASTYNGFETLKLHTLHNEYTLCSFFCEFQYLLSVRVSSFIPAMHFNAITNWRFSIPVFMLFYVKHIYFVIFICIFTYLLEEHL